MYKPKQTKIISSIRFRKLVGQGCLDYLSHSKDVEVELYLLNVLPGYQNLEKCFLLICLVCLRIEI